MRRARTALITCLIASVFVLSASAGEVEELAQGKFLVASSGLSDPNFRWTVVLLLNYGDHGAMGLVINRPTETLLVDILPEVDALKDSGATAFVGGPVQVDRVMTLFRSGEAPEDAKHVFADVYATRSRGLLQRLSGDEKNETRFRVYVGYSGWAPGQLDHEVNRGDWHVVPADAETVFSQGSIRIWRDLTPGQPGDWTRARPYGPVATDSETTTTASRFGPE